MAFQGSLKELPLPDIIQLVSVSGKTGQFDLVNESENGQIYLREGQIVHAEAGELEGEEAVYELAIWPQGDFVFTPGRESRVTSIQKSNTNLLMEAARRIDEWQVLSKRISSTRLVPVFTDQTVSTSVSFTPQEWSIISRVDERRTIEEIAVALGMSPFETCKHLYGLVTSGLVDLKEDLTRRHVEKLRKMSVSELSQLSEKINQLAQRMLKDHPRLAELDPAYRLSRAELSSGRGVDSVLDLVRGQEKVVSASLGPNQAKAFGDRLKELLVVRP
jgi:hypothetical protein